MRNRGFVLMCTCGEGTTFIDLFYCKCRDTVIDIGSKITYTFCGAAGLEMYILKYYFSKT